MKFDIKLNTGVVVFVDDDCNDIIAMLSKIKKSGYVVSDSYYTNKSFLITQ